MRFGISMFVTDETVDPLELGPMLEQRGFHSLFVPEHSHIPVDHSPHPSGQPLPEFYKRTYDPFVLLAAIAGVTQRLRLGFGIALVTQRDPIETAKAVASLDLLSRGRVDFGVGAGWNAPELAHHGTAMTGRFALMKERVEAIRALWTEEQASYEGRYVRFAPSWSWPKPVQQPLPIYMGGMGPKAVDRVVDYADAWMPNRLEDDLGERVADLRRRFEAAGKPRPDVTFFGAQAKPEFIQALADAGVDQALLLVPPRAPDEVERALDAAAALAAEFEGRS